VLNINHLSFIYDTFIFNGMSYLFISNNFNVSAVYLYVLKLWWRNVNFWL